MSMLEVMLTRPDNQVYALVSTGREPDIIRLVTPQDNPTRKVEFACIRQARMALINAAVRDPQLYGVPLPKAAQWAPYPKIKPRSGSVMVIHDGRVGVASIISQPTHGLSFQGKLIPANEEAWWAYVQ